MPSSTEWTATIQATTYRVQMHCSGKGSPAVVLDSNLRGLSRDWETVRGRIARLTTVCTYDRSGIARPPLTSEQIVSDLHALLHSTGVEVPYILVGWAFGGYTTRLFASRYRSEVAGMVLLDPLHEDFFTRYRAILPPVSPGGPDLLEDFRYQLAGGYRYLADMEGSAAQVRARRMPLGEMPLIIVSRGDPDWPQGLPLPVVDRLEQTWQDMQADLVSLSTNCTRIIAERSGHLIQYDRPDLVVEAIRTVIEAVRKQSQRA